MIQALFHRHKPGEPCVHMEGILHRCAEGKASRFAKWYAAAHTARCTPCRKFLERLEQVLDGLKAAKAPSPDAATLDRLMDGYHNALNDVGRDDGRV